MRVDETKIEDIRTWVNGSTFHMRDLPKVRRLRELFKKVRLDKKRIQEVYSGKVYFIYDKTAIENYKGEQIVRLVPTYCTKKECMELTKKLCEVMNENIT